MVPYSLFPANTPTTDDCWIFGGSIESQITQLTTVGNISTGNGVLISPLTSGTYTNVGVTDSLYFSRYSISIPTFTV
jgi:hypothetical protein